MFMTGVLCTVCGAQVYFFGVIFFFAFHFSGKQLCPLPNFSSLSYAIDGDAFCADSCQVLQISNVLCYLRLIWFTFCESFIFFLQVFMEKFPAQKTKNKPETKKPRTSELREKESRGVEYFCSISF